jgi:lipid A 3-O-deacylase
MKSACTAILLLTLLPSLAWAQDEAPPAEAPETPSDETPQETPEGAPELPADEQTQAPADSSPIDNERGPDSVVEEPPAPAERETLSRFTVMSENDKFAGTDRFYTNGFKVAYQRTDVGAVSEFFSEALNLIPFLKAKPLAYGFVVGQDIYTPEDTEERRLIPDDRPYSGWLYGGLTLTRGNVPLDGEAPLEEGKALFQDRIELLFGAIGVDALGRQVQNNWHEFINVATSKGWRNQLRSEPGFEIYTQRKWLLKVWHGEGATPGADFLPHVGLAIGHPFTHFSIGGTFRFGWNLGEDFGPVQRIASAGFDRPRKTEGVQFYVYARIEGRLVGWNAFIQGNLFHNKRRRFSTRGIRENVHIEVERVVADFEVGMVLQLWRFEISYTNVIRTREFEEQKDTFVYGAIHGSITW